MWARSSDRLRAGGTGLPDGLVASGAQRDPDQHLRNLRWRIILPQAWPTVVTVFITVLIGVMKVFDIVYAMTNGNYNTNVLGNAFYASLFRAGDPGVASAIVVILIIAIIPVLVYQVRQFRLQEANA